MNLTATARAILGALSAGDLQRALLALDQVAASATCPAERGIAQALARSIRTARD